MTMRESDPAAAAAEVTAGAVLVDVREDDEWTVGHAPEAIHVPLSAFDAALIPPGVPIAVICRSGARSARAATALDEAGRDATNVVGGMLAWQRSGLPVITDDGGPGDVLV